MNFPCNDFWSTCYLSKAIDTANNESMTQSPSKKDHPQETEKYCTSLRSVTLENPFYMNKYE